MPLFGMRPNPNQIQILWERGKAPQPDYSPRICRCGNVGTLRMYPVGTNHIANTFVEYRCTQCFRILHLDTNSGLQCWYTREIETWEKGDHWDG